MSNSNQNNDQSWRRRLDELESIPSELQPDKKITWNKLQARLEDKPRSKKKYWYWAAAAILLISFVLPRIIVKKEEPILVKTSKQNNPAKRNVSSAPLKDSRAVKTISDKIIKAAKNDKALAPNISSKENKTSTQNKNQYVSLPKPTENETVVRIISSIPDTVNNTATVVSKKKLTVIHINELERNSNPAELSNNNNSFRRFIRPSNKDVSVGVPAGNGYNGDHIIIRNVNSQNQD